MRKTILLLIMVFLLALSSSALAAPLTGTNPDGSTYSLDSLKITFRQIDFHNQTTNTWVTVFTGSREIDITAGLGNIVGGANLLPGTYDKMFIYMNSGDSTHGIPGVVYSGTVTSGGTTYTTPDTISLDITPDDVYHPEDPDAIGGEPELLSHKRGVAYGLYGTDVFMTPFSIVEGQTRNIVMKLKTDMSYDSSGSILTDQYSLSHLFITVDIN